MPAGYQDIYLEKGTDFNTQITLDDSTGAAMNLTNYTAFSSARLSYNSVNAALVFTTQIDPATGTIQLSANSATTANIYAGPVNKLVYDVIIKDSANTVTRILEGQIYVSPSVTRS